MYKPFYKPFKKRFIKNASQKESFTKGIGKEGRGVVRWR